jgi:hypothetical protein
LKILKIASSRKLKQKKCCEQLNTIAKNMGEQLNAIYFGLNPFSLKNYFHFGSKIIFSLRIVTWRSEAQFLVISNPTAFSSNDLQ